MVPKATLTAWVEKLKRDYKRCAKPFKQAEHTLYPRHRVHPVVQLPISITSSVPEMSASRSPRGLLLLPSLATKDATSAFTVPLWPQEVGGGGCCIIGLKLEYWAKTRAQCSESRPTRADLCVTPSPTTILMLIFGKYVGRGCFPALFVSLLSHGSFTCRSCHRSPLVFDRSALTKLEAIGTVTGGVVLTVSVGGGGRSEQDSINGRSFP